VSWLQIGCPFCPSEINLPAMMADTEIACGDCGKSYLVPTPDAPVLAAGPLAPVAILRTPGLGGNTAAGMAPIALLPVPIAADAPTPLEAGPLGAGLSSPAPPKLHRGGGAPLPWELSPEVRASAAAIFGAEPEPIPDEDELEAVERRMRKEKIRSIARMALVGLGMTLMIGLLTFFLRR
jgi:hypothetical protein